MQTSGLREVDLKDQKALHRHLRPIAHYTGHGIENDNEKFIAIAEGIEMPIYAFTYGIEMIQFFFEDPSATLDNFQLDHSIIARKHAQTIANLIAAEARMSDHSFDHEDSVFENLVRHEEIAKITYNSKSLSNKEKWSLPLGMNTHDVYILH